MAHERQVKLSEFFRWSVGQMTRQQLVEEIKNLRWVRDQAAHEYGLERERHEAGCDARIAVCEQRLRAIDAASPRRGANRG